MFLYCVKACTVTYNSKTIYLAIGDQLQIDESMDFDLLSDVKANMDARNLVEALAPSDYNFFGMEESEEESMNCGNENCQCSCGKSDKPDVFSNVQLRANFTDPS